MLLSLLIKLQVGRAGQKKKARMARTRSDFLTRAPVLSVGGDSDEDDYNDNSSVSPVSPRHHSLPLAKQSPTEAGLRESCFSDSDMVKGAIPANSSALYAHFDISNPLSREQRSSSLTQTVLQQTFWNCSLTFYKSGRHFKGISRQVFQRHFEIPV